jgi:chromate transporter
MEMFNFFWTLFYINLFTIGGGFAMIPLLQSEVVERYHWLTQQEFLESIAVGQMTPGPLTVMNAYIGMKVFGITGALGATVSTYLPSLILTTIAAHYYQKIKNNNFVSAAMLGLKPAVVGLIAAAALTLAGSSMTEPGTIAIGIISLSLLLFTKTDPTILIIGSAAAGALFL